MKVELLGITYNVKVLDKQTQEKSDLLGMYDSNTATIFLAEGMPRGIRTRTFLHELIHMEDDHLEIGLSEKQVSRLAAGLLGISVDGRGIVRL